MSLDQAARELVALMDILIACAGVVLAAAAVLLAAAAVRRLRAPRPVTYAIAVPPGPAPAPELLFTHLHSLLRPAGWLSPAPEILVAAIASSEGLRLVVSLPERSRSSLGASLDALWPGAKLLKAEGLARPSAKHLWHPTVVGTQRLAAIASAAPAFVRSLTRVSPGEQLCFEITLRRETGRPSLRLGLVRNQIARAPHQRTAQTRRHVPGPLFDTCVVVSARAATTPRARTLVRDLMPSVEALCTGTGVELERRRGFVGDGVSTAGSLAPSDLAFLFPLVALAAATRTPAWEANEGERLIGRCSAGGRDADVRISLAASRHHLHVLGPTGTGKSTLLLNLVIQDIDAGRGCAVLDPKGDLVHELLSRIPRRRISDVVYVGPEEGTRVVGINPLSLGPDEDPHLACENVLSIFKRIYEENWGPRTDDVLKSCLLTLVAVPGSTIAHIPALLAEPALRKKYLAHLDDEIGVGGFWRWYERISEGKRLEVTAPLQNKLRDVLVRPRLRRLLCQSRSTVDLRRVIDGGGILLADLGAGRWGESASALAGSFLVARLWQAALSRQALPEERRRDFLLYVDEFHSFMGIGGPFADALAQARGLRLSLTIANQHLGQLPREIRDAASANARSKVVFRCAAGEAATLAADLSPVDAEALIRLRPFEAAVRLPSMTEATTVRTLPSSRPPADAADARDVLAASASRFGRDIASIDSALREVLAMPGDTHETSRQRTA